MKVMPKRIIKIGLFLIVAMLINIATISFVNFELDGKVAFTMEIKSNQPDTYQVFYDIEQNWTEEKSTRINYESINEWQVLEFPITKDVGAIRIDVGNLPTTVEIRSPRLTYVFGEVDLTNEVAAEAQMYSQLQDIVKNEEVVKLTSNGTDPYIIINLGNKLTSQFEKIDNNLNILFKVVVCIGVNIILILFVKKRRAIFKLGNELIEDRSLIWNLAKNDFKTRYAGSYLGIFWAFVQPIISILLYWFVFQVGFKSAPVENFPFVLWLVMGLVPWFFFSEAVTSATNSLLEYSYLVKKVVFKISVLPIVKIISALFIHFFFLVFAIILFMGYGYHLDIYAIQIIYYMTCLIILVLGISYATSAIILFFKDLGQIIGIFMQVGMWMTPIMWSYDIIPEQYQWIIKLNPMDYIVQGYRNAMIDKVWFWNNINSTIYFLIVCIILFVTGTLIFKKLKDHFADVL